MEAGRVRETFERILGTVIPKHGPFDAWFCMAASGESLNSDDQTYLREQVPKTSFPIYLAFLCGEGSLEENPESIANLRIIHSVDSLKMIQLDGLKVAFVFKRKKREDYLPTLEAVDILFSWDQPPSITNNSNGPYSKESSNDLDYMTARLVPRYHFSIGTGTFWERFPYRGMADGQVRPCRFFCLANAMNPDQKWMYAMSIKGRCDLPANITPNPFTHNIINESPILDPPTEPHGGPNYFFQLDPATNKRPVADLQRAALETAANNCASPTTGRIPPPGYACKQCMDTKHFYRNCPYRANPHLRRNTTADQEQQQNPYICHKCHKPGHPIRSCPLWLEEGSGNAPTRSEIIPENTSEGPLKRPKKAKPSEPCWFCLGNPKVRKHLIIDVGTEAYLALARGPLTRTHMLVIPIDHTVDRPATVSPIHDQIYGHYVKRVRDHFAGRKDQQHLVTWSHQTKGQHHWHLQVLTIPTSSFEKETIIEERLVEHSKQLGYPLLTKDPTMVDDGCSFEMTVYLVDGGQVSLTHRFDQSTFFPAQFGRQLMANLLGMTDESLDWRNTRQSDEQESRMVAQLKRDFGMALQ